MDDRPSETHVVRARRAKRARRAELRREARMTSGHPATARTASAPAATEVQPPVTQPDGVIDLREEVIGHERAKGLVRT
jgi:hypothetical protein